MTVRTEVGDEHLDLPEFELRIARGEISPQSLVRWPAVTGEAFVPAVELELYQIGRASCRERVYVLV